MSVQGTAAPAMSSAAWDRALQQDMKAEGNLHPALCTPDGHYQARLFMAALQGGPHPDSSAAQRPAAAGKVLTACVGIVGH